jgi:hypothetical protein
MQSYLSITGSRNYTKILSRNNLHLRTKFEIFKCLANTQHEISTRCNTHEHAKFCTAEVMQADLQHISGNLDGCWTGAWIDLFYRIYAILKSQCIMAYLGKLETWAFWNLSVLKPERFETGWAIWNLSVSFASLGFSFLAENKFKCLQLVQTQWN